MIPETAGHTDRTRRLIRGAAVTACLLALVAGGCGREAEPLRAPAQTVTATPTPQPTTTPAPAQDYDAFIADVESSLDAFWSRELPRVAGTAYQRLPGGYVPYDPQDPSTAPICQGQPLAPPGNAYFCVDGFIAYDEPGLVHKDFVEKGEAAAAATLAHETGHWVLHQLGIEGSTQWEDEEGADCLAGAYLGDVAANGGIEIGDAEAISALLEESADDRPTRHEAPDGHGDSHERHAALIAGIQGGAEGCLGGV